MKIGIVDYGMGNIRSVWNAVRYLGYDAVLCENGSALASLDKYILPGVGAFPDCMSNLKSRGFVDGLHEAVKTKNKPILGICLGMQVMAKTGTENGLCNGLGWFDAEVVRIIPGNSRCRVPHVGWNELSFRSKDPLFESVAAGSDVYFVHSYFMSCRNSADVIATCDHGDCLITAAVRSGNIVGTQFHPEKSQDCGLKILSNFLNA